MALDPDTQREIDNLKAHFETIISSQHALNAEKIAADRETLRAAMASNDKRLESMNEFRLALSDQANTMITRHESDAAHNALVEKTEQMRVSLETKIESEAKSVNVKVDQIGKPNWALLASGVSIFLMMVTGVWLVIGLKIDSTLTPLSLAIQESKVALASDTQRLGVVELAASASTSADAASRADRAEIGDRIRKIESQLNDSVTNHVEIEQKLIEVETQFCASDIVRNLMHANDLRVQSVVWSKLFPDSKYPTDNSYYPTVCNRQGLPTNGH